MPTTKTTTTTKTRLVFALAVLVVLALILVAHEMTELHTWRAAILDNDDEGAVVVEQQQQQQQQRQPKNNNATSTTTTSTTTSSTWVSYPKTTNRTTMCSEWRSTTTVAPRMLLGGGKAGSTGLYYMLYEGNRAAPSSGLGWNASHLFAAPKKGKELCYGGWFQTGSVSREGWEDLFTRTNPSQTMGLDFCPQGTERTRICRLWEIFPCEIKFVMLVRDPADRARSWFNDKGSSGQSDASNVDRYAAGMVRNRNFQLRDILRDALFGCGVDPRAVLVVDADGLTGTPSEAQLVMDDVHDHYGMPRMVHEQILNNRGDLNDDRHPHDARLRPETATRIRAVLQPQTRGFLDLLERPEEILRKSLLSPDEMTTAAATPKKTTPPVPKPPPPKPPPPSGLGFPKVQWNISEEEEKRKVPPPSKMTTDPSSREEEGEGRESSPSSFPTFAPTSVTTAEPTSGTTPFPTFEPTK